MTVSAHVVCDSVSPEGKRLLSVGVTAHRFILAEINTHRVLSRSYRSSRAVPSKRLIEEVRTNPAMPIYWGANEPGMQANGELVGYAQVRAQEIWRFAARDAAGYAEALATAGLHKQIANRVLEPFLWVHGIITATEWDNFFGLRLHSAAQPEFRALADAIWYAAKASTPKRLRPGQWHLPYADDEETIADCSTFYSDLMTAQEVDGLGQLPWDDEDELRRTVSVARCARSSYASFETGKRSTINEDVAVVKKLNIPGTESYDPAAPIHASPAEHQATPDFSTGHIFPAFDNERESGNFCPGWRQYRKMLHGEAVAPLPKGYER